MAKRRDVTSDRFREEFDKNHQHRLETAGVAHDYVVHEGVIAQEWYNRPENGRPEQIGHRTMCNFHARIVADVIRDSGPDSEPMRYVELVGGNHRRSFERIRVPAADLHGTGWITKYWGTDLVVNLECQSGEFMRALQLISLTTGKETRTEYAHTGWRRIDGRWLYLHRDGAISADGPTSALVTDLCELPDYCLPAPPAGGSLRTDCRAVLDLLQAGPDVVMVPVVAAPFLAVLGGADLSLHLFGPSGARKTTLACILQSFFGPRMADPSRLPATWEDTDNALEGKAYLAKDALIVIDDMAPKSTYRGVQELKGKMDRVFRAQGNRLGRGRMNADATLKGSKPPRGLIVSTGEDFPPATSESLRARVLMVEIAKGALKTGTGSDHA